MSGIALNSSNYVKEKIFSFLQLISFKEPMKTRAPQLHLEYRFYKQLGIAGKYLKNIFFF
jgi:cyanate lyase